MRQKIGIALIFLLGLCIPQHTVLAQSPEDTRRSLQLLQEHVEQLQQQLQALARTPSATRPHVYLDVAQVYNEGYVVVQGWAFECGKEQVKAQILIDGIVAEFIKPAYVPRSDVVGAFAGYCEGAGLTFPISPGMTFLVDLRNYAPGEHTLQVWLLGSNSTIEKSNRIKIVR